MCEFEKKVLDGFISCNVKRERIGIAVSGGADSVSLLLSLTKNFPDSNFYVITVNHNIRPKEECGGDAAFVFELCERLKKTDINIICKIVELPCGAVDKSADERGQGIEDAARFLRYKAFEQFITENNLDCLCLAHNKNDQLETVLMRFLNGADIEAVSGIKNLRGKIVRPMLSVTRKEIESYLQALGQTWRTDSTNADENYLRNKIRLKLVPFLNENFCGWETAVLNGAEKNEYVAAVMQDLVDSFSMKVLPEQVEIEKNAFFAQPFAVQCRLLLKACNLAGENCRIPYAFIKEVLRNPQGKKVFGTLEICLKKDCILVKKSVKTHTESVFSAIIEESGTYSFPFGELTVNQFELPCCVRSARLDDFVETADGKAKKVSDIYADWHVPVEQRSLIPVVQKLKGKKQEIVAVLGSVLGFSDWIVK